MKHTHLFFSLSFLLACSFAARAMEQDESAIKDLIQETLDTLKKYPNPFTQHYYMKELPKELDIEESLRQEQVDSFLKYVKAPDIQYPVKNEELIEFLQKRIKTANEILSLERISEKEYREECHMLFWKDYKYFHKCGINRMWNTFSETVEKNHKALLSQQMERPPYDEGGALILNAQMQFKKESLMNLVLGQSKKFACIILEQLQDGNR